MAYELLFSRRESGFVIQPLLGRVRPLGLADHEALSRLRCSLCLGLDRVESSAKVLDLGLHEAHAIGERPFLVHKRQF
jgi:hypothetical protein